MAEKETKNKPKDLIEAVPEELEKLEQAEEKLKEAEFKEEIIAESKEKAIERQRKEREANELSSWVPKTSLGKRVKAGEEKGIDNLIDSGKKILESEIVDLLVKTDFDLLAIGQAKGKFGGGKRRAWRQTQKKTKEGNILTFSCMAVVGDKKGHVGVGVGKAKETLPARAKAVRQAKLNILRITRGFESPDDTSSDPHTIPFVVEGKCGSVRIKLLPAPRGTGLVIGDQGKKILKLAGIKDIYAVTKGQTRTTFNVAKALIDALKKTNEMKL